MAFLIHYLFFNIINIYWCDGQENDYMEIPESLRLPDIEELKSEMELRLLIS